MNAPSRGGNAGRDAGNFNRGGTGDFNRAGTGDFNRAGAGDFNRAGAGDFNRAGTGDFNRAGDFNRGGNLNPAVGERPGAAPSRDQLNNFLGLPGQDNARRNEAAGQRRDDQRRDDQRLDGQRRDEQRTAGDRTPGTRDSRENNREGNRDSRQTDRDSRENNRDGNRDSRQTDRDDRRTDGFDRHSASDRYQHANDVRNNFNHYDLYGRDWYRNQPQAWFAAGWAAGNAWSWNNWASVGAWMAYPAVTPVYYDYGNNVTYNDNSIYVSGENVGTAAEYYNQAADIAADGAKATDNDADWLPLGVFAFCKSGESSSDLVLQLAVNKQGVVRGNYTDTANNKTQAVNGSVDKETQRVAFTIGDNRTNIVETGLYNLTKDEAPALLHYGQDRTEQWLLVRLKQPDDSAK